MSSIPAAQFDISNVLSRVVETYRKTAPVLLSGALIVFLPVAGLTALLANSAAAIFVAVLSLVASVWYSGMVVKAVQDVQDGRVDSSIGELFASTTPVLGQLFVVGLIAGLGIALGFVLLIVPGLILLTMWSVAAPVVVMEKPGALAALGRSRQLVRGHGWPVFGVIVAIFFVLLAVSVVIGSIGVISNSAVLTFVFNLVLNVAVAPVYALAAAVMYFALREAHGDLAAGGAPSPAGRDRATQTDAFGLPVQPSPPSGGFAPPTAAPPTNPSPHASTPPPSTPPPPGS